MIIKVDDHRRKTADIVMIEKDDCCLQMETNVIYARQVQKTTHDDNDDCNHNIDDDNNTDDYSGKLMADHSGDVNPSDLCKAGTHVCRASRLVVIMTLSMMMMLLMMLLMMMTITSCSGW